MVKKVKQCNVWHLRVWNGHQDDPSPLPKSVREKTFQEQVDDCLEQLATDDFNFATVKDIKYTVYVDPENDRNILYTALIIYEFEKEIEYCQNCECYSCICEKK